MLTIGDALPKDTRQAIEGSQGTNFRSYEHRAKSGMLLVRPLSTNSFAFPALDHWAKRFGYEAFEFGRYSTYFYEKTAEGVKALFKLRGATLWDTDDPLVKGLAVDDRDIPIWVGTGGENAKKFAEILGIRYLRIISNR